ncbi:hypothetical protein JIG36_49795 [Actinoplanes sp. LDG1-06]|uniref:HTH marR-type domain-containing protein n=1 Tax=Paractinoplanes ovalisporus TaxID=2810368 RepID=A0ABS2AUQ6_9ACTN|nr:hypothetical protein [Actinoplanes ovalisporus]MBM2623609.1 hypothetical protein [Actinoplanes ovalisporus]
MVNGTPVDSLNFRLGVLGSIQEGRWAARLARYDLKPKHVALLSALRLGHEGAQQDLAVTLRVAPSLVVLLADHLVALEAVERVRDHTDRRRQRLQMTPEGDRLLDLCTADAQELDNELAASLTAADRAALTRVLAKLAAAEGLPS